MKLIKLISVLFIVSTLISCESTLTDDESDFCIEVNNLNFSEIENNIEEYLDYVNAHHVETDVYYEIEISKLKNWMETKSCVSEVTIPTGIVEVGPGIKHIQVVFVSPDSTFSKYLDIMLDSNLDVRFH